MRWKRPKYNNKKTQVGSLTFDSKAEADAYILLKMAEERGAISDLKTKCPECRFKLHVNGILVATYVADFVYTDNGERVVADKKGYRTDVYKLKKKLMKAILGIEILEL